MSIANWPVSEPSQRRGYRVVPLLFLPSSTSGISAPLWRSWHGGIAETESPNIATRGPGQKWWLGPLYQVSAMTSADSLSLILRRLDEIERKLDRMLEELRTPTAIGYSVGRGNRPKKD
jgi:hypothetical protein